MKYYNSGNNKINMKLISYKLIPKEDLNDINLDLINTGVFSRKEKRNEEDEIWRVKKHEIKPITSQEEKYLMNEILKQYELNTMKNNNGLNYKYFQNFTDLLTKKNYQKLYPKKRLELFYNRLEDLKKKKSIKNYSSNIFLEAYDNRKSKKDRTSTFITYIERFNKTKGEKFSKKNYKYNYIDNLYNNSFNNKQCKYSNNTVKNNIINLKDIYSFSPKLGKTQSYFMKNIKRNFSRDSSFRGSQYNYDHINNSIDEEKKVKEEFFLIGDKTKYIAYLQNKYNFYYKPKTTQLKYINEKKRRSYLFKNKANSKFLEKEKKDSFKIELFNKIKRDNLKRFCNTYNITIKSEKKRGKAGISLREVNKDLFDKEYKNILKKIQNNK